ncbi:MAG: hypothetical protein UV36_C0015G0003 [Parcubacteria group bacterium GW2011_GWC2_42_6]|nr:MAG: hypothetical protein UU87_C0002G0064 [Parcubacteria group bacterium GW2011_GWA2_42_11]KKS66901.1 MAG: hypothetical protein UV36_C0015G0003 [Parcubacteria group bacterium GW2011_GWC2_42_6]
MEIILSQVKIKTLMLAVGLGAAAVLTPLVFHYFGGIDIGRTFLPMYFFVMLAGLALNWRSALGVAVFAPILSHLISGMPVAAMMPTVILELIIYTLAAGLFYRLFNKNIWLAAISAILAAKIILAGISFLPIHFTTPSYIIDSIKIGWRGILLQLISMPFLAKYIIKLVADEKIQ